MYHITVAISIVCNKCAIYKIDKTLFNSFDCISKRLALRMWFSTYQLNRLACLFQLCITVDLLPCYRLRNKSLFKPSPSSAQGHTCTQFGCYLRRVVNQQYLFNMASFFKI